MAFHVHDQNGEIVKSDILVTGYIRQDVEKDMSQEIPNELYQLCYLYWLYNVCDSWNSKFQKDDIIKTDGDKITLSPATCTVYGNHVVVDGSKYNWKVKMNKFGYGEGAFKDFVKLWNPTIGIIKDDADILKKSLSTCNWTSEGNGYAFVGGSKALVSTKAIGKGLYSEKARKFNQVKDIIEIHLDLINYTIKYEINDIDCGIAYDDVDRDTNSRLAVAMMNGKNISVELL